MFNDRGFYQSLRVHGYLCKIHKIGPIGRAILAHINEQSYFDSAIYISCSRRLSEELSANQKSILHSQRKLKDYGLLLYPSEFGSKLMPYYLPYKIIGVEKGLFVITRNWHDAVAIAHKNKLISNPDGEELIMKVALKGRLWYQNPEYMKCLTRNVAPDDVSLENIIGGNIKPVYARQNAEDLIEVGQRYLEEIKNRQGAKLT